MPGQHVSVPWTLQLRAPKNDNFKTLWDSEEGLEVQRIANQREAQRAERTLGVRTRVLPRKALGAYHQRVTLLVARELWCARPEGATMVSARSLVPACVGGGSLGEFKHPTLIGKGSFDRVHHGVRLCDNIE